MRAPILLALLLAALVLPPAVEARGEGPRIVCTYRTVTGGSGPRQHPSVVRVCRTIVPPETFVWYRP